MIVLGVGQLRSADVCECCAWLSHHCC